MGLEVGNRGFLGQCISVTSFQRVMRFRPDLTSCKLLCGAAALALDVRCTGNR